MREAVILSAARTPTGRFLGALRQFSATELGALVVREAVRRAALSADLVDECILGNVVGAGLGQAPARQAALHGGLTPRVAALTVNKVCGSGLKAVMLAAQGIATSDIDVAVAGGMESMSNAPHLLPRLRQGVRMGNATALDALVHDGLWDAFHDIHMGMTGEYVAEQYRVSRQDQDRHAAESHRRAADATRAGRFADEILPVAVDGQPGHQAIGRDEQVREDTTVEALARLAPAFKKDGTVTAGNASGISDGAAALVLAGSDVAARLRLAPRARVVGFATAGVEPKLVMMAPVDAVRRLLSRIGWSTGDVDLFELNEAFSAQAVAVTRELDLDPDRVNVNGGAVALGHPIGASGARILTTLLHALEQRGKQRGVATLCLGGGNGVAMAIERHTVR